MVAGSFGAGDRLGVQRQGPGRVDGADDHEIAQQALGQQHVVAEPPGPLDRLLPERAPCLRLAGEVMRAAQCRQGSAEQPLVAQLAGDLDRLFSKLPCRGDVNEASDERGGDQCRGEQRGVGVGVGPPEHRHEQPEGLLLPGPGPPVAASATPRRSTTAVPSGPAGRMPGGAPQVGLIGVQPGQPAALLRPGQISRRRLGHGQEMRAVRRGDRGGLAVAGLDQPLGGEQPDRLQQPVPQRFPGGLGHHQALVHQRPEQIRDIQHIEVTGPAHRLGRVQAEAAGEHRQARQQHPLGAGQQRIRPADRRPQRLLAFQRGAAAPGQQPEPLIQPAVQLGQRHRPQPGRGQLDRQRHPVQPPAHRHRQRPGLLVHGKATPCARARSANSATASEDPGAERPDSPGPGSDSDGTR